MSSSRRSSADVNILAMLDGLGARPQGRRKLLWYGAGGVLACALVGSLAWMVRNAAPAAGAGTSTVALELPAPAATQAALPAPRGGATIVDLPSMSTADGTPADPPHATAAPMHAPASMHAPKAGATHQPAARTGAAAARPAPHPGAKRPAAARSPAAPAAVDTDVALISAIIQHAAKQGADAGGAGCADKPCAPRTPPHP